MATRLEIKKALEQDRAQIPANWRDVLWREIVHDPRGKLGLAERMGVSRVYVSRVATEHIPDSEVSPRFIARLLEAVNAIECPHTHEPMPPSICRGYASRTYASLSFAEVEHWRACQSCIHNPLNRADQRGCTQ